MTGAAERAWAESVAHALPEPILLIDSALTVTGGNAAALALLARDRPRVVGRPLPALLVPRDAEALRRAGATLLDGQIRRSSSGVLLEDGAHVPVTLEIRPMHIGGRVQGALVLVRPASGGAPTGGAPPRDAVKAELASELGGALRGDQIVLHYQPIVRLSDERPVMAEALVRWEHPRRGLLPPSQFLDLVDTPALALALGTRVLREAAHVASVWQRTTGSDPAIQLSVNLSEGQLLQPGTVELVRQALVVAACPPDLLIVEVAERALVRDPEAARAALGALKALGIEIAIDNVGNTTAQLDHLRTVPLDFLKVDRALVADLETDREKNTVMESLVSSAHARGAQCVAEGVETSEQLGRLRQLGVDLGQGYLFTRALNQRSATQWLSRAASGRAPQPAAMTTSSSSALQRALEMQGEGASLHTIAARLNGDGHRNAGGRRWTHTSVALLVSSHRVAGAAR